MRATHLTAASNFAIAALTAGTSIAIARLMGPEIRGHYAQVTATAGTAVTIGILGAHTYLAREAGKSAGTAGVQRIVLILTAILTAPALALAELIGHLGSNNEFRDGLAILVALVIPVSMYSTFLLHLALGQQAWRQFNIARLLTPGLTAILALLCAASSIQSTEALTVCLLAGTLASALYLRSSLHSGASELYRVRLRHLRIIARGSLPYSLNSISSVAVGYFDLIVTASILPLASVGYWTAARTVGSLLGPISNAMSLAAFAKNVKHKSPQMDWPRFAQLGFLNSLGGITLVLLAPAFVPTFFGQAFSPSIPLILPALIAAAASASAEFVEESLRGGGNPGPVTAARLSQGAILSLPLAGIVTIESMDQFALLYTGAVSSRLLLSTAYVAIVRQTKL